MKSFKLGLFIIINLALGCHLLLAVEFDVNSTILNDDPDNVVFLESIDMEDRVGAYFHWSKGDLPSAQGKNIGIIKTSIRGLCTPVFPFLSTYNDWYVIPVLSTQLGAREIATVPRSIIDPLGIDPKNIDLSVVIQCTPVLEKQYGFDHILLQPHPYLHDFSGPFTAYTSTNTKCHMFRLDDRGGVFREVALIGDQNCISHTDQLSGNSRWIEGIDPTNINYDEFYTFISVVQVGTTTRNDGKITVQTPGRVAITLHILVPGIFVQRPSIFLEMLPHENVTTAMFITAYEAYAKANGNREDIVASLEALKGLFTLSPSAPTLPPSSAKTTPVTTTSPYVDQTEVAATTCSSFVDFSQASPPLCPGPKEYSDETNLFMGKVAAYGAPAQYWGWHADIRSNPWIKFELTTPTMISSFGFKGQPLDVYGQQRAPKNFILEGSMDDRLWTPLLNISNHTVGNAANWNDFTISNPGIYKFLKLTVRANGGDLTYLIISQVRMLKYVPTALPSLQQPSGLDCGVYTAYNSKLFLDQVTSSDIVSFFQSKAQDKAAFSIFRDNLNIDQTEVAATTCSSFVDFSQAAPPLRPGPKEYSDETNLFMGKVAAYGAPAQYWGWHADIRSNPWIKFELKTPTIISSFGFKGQPLDCYGPQRAPRNFILEGSMDDRLWTPLLNISNHTVGNPTNWSDFTISTPGIYKFFRLTVTANGGDPTYLIISQVRISPFGSNLQDQDVIGIFEQRHVFANHRQQIVLASGDLFKDDAGFPSTMRLENRLRQHIEGASQLVAESRAELRRLATSTSGTSGDEIARANMTISTCTPLINQNQKLLGAITAKTVPYVVMVAIKPDNKWHGTQHYVAFGIRDNHGTIEVYYADSLTATSPEKTAHINRIGELLKQAFSR